MGRIVIEVLARPGSQDERIVHGIMMHLATNS